jgi:radical SAM superfamily enzyme YgiQ (UPF0313 family)
MNVSDVIIGFESGSRRVLKKCGKGGVSPEDNLSAAKNLFDNDIDVCASYVLGLPGETEQSLFETYENAKRLIQLSKDIRGTEPFELVANLIEPNPGSPAFRVLKHVFPEKYVESDVIDLADSQNDYFKHFFKLTTPDDVMNFRKNLVEWAKKMNALTLESDFQGFQVGECFDPRERIVQRSDSFKEQFEI